MNRQLDKLETLYRINETILSVLDLSDLLDKVLKIIEDTFGFDSCAILFFDEISKELYIKAAVGYKTEQIKKFRTKIGGRGITGHVARIKKPLYIKNIKEDTRYVPGVNGANSEIAIPLLTKDQFIGILDIESKKEYIITDDDFKFLCSFADQLARAIKNALIFEKERKKVSQLTVFNKIRARISVSLELDKLLNIVASSIIEFFNYDMLFILLFNEDSKKLEIMAKAGMNDSDLNQEDLKNIIDRSVNRCFLENKNILMNFPHADSQIHNVRSELSIPLKINEGPIGVVYIGSEATEVFDERDIFILEAICEQMTMLIKDASMFSTISKRSRQLEIIHKIGQVAIQSFDLRNFIKDTVDYIQSAFGYYQISVFSYEEVSKNVELLAYAGALPKNIKPGDKLPVDHGVIGHVARSGQFYLCNDVIRESKYRDIMDNTKSELAIPIRSEEKLLGILNIESSSLNQFDKTDVETFQKIADQIAYTIVNAELFKQKSSAHNLLLNLNTLGREINATFDLDKMLSCVVEKLPFYVNCRLCSIFFHYPKDETLVLKSHNLPDISPSASISMDISQENLMGRVISLKRSIFVKDIENELNIQNKPKYQTKSFLNMLIKQHDRIIGVLNLTDKIDHSYFTSQEFFLINSFCDHLANAITNSEKYQKILELSITDGLTSLYVHRFFQDSLKKEIARSERTGSGLALIMLDIDDFKKVNDKYGHQVGDIVLREIAFLIKKEIRPYDIPSRYGGEEFAVILPNTNILQASVIAERVRQRIENHSVVHATRNLNATVSIGVNEFKPGMDNYELINQTDMALLKAKQKGKNQVISYSDPL